MLANGLEIIINDIVILDVDTSSAIKQRSIDFKIMEGFKISFGVGCSKGRKIDKKL